MSAAHSVRCDIAVAAALYLAVLGLLLLPGPATAQIVDYALLLTTLAPPSQPAQDSPSGLRSPGERGVTRVWSAVEQRPSLGRKHSKEICLSLPSAPPAGGVCSMTADELLAASRQAPKPPAGAPNSLSDAGRGLANAFSRMESALSGKLDRPATPVPMRAADLAKAATGDFVSGHLESALDKAKQMLDASLSNRETAVSLGMIGRFCTALGRPEKADGFLDKALRITRGVGADGIKATAHILDAEGQLYRQQGKYEAAAGAFKEALAIHQADERDKRDVARTLNQMALVSEETGDQAAALSLYERGIALAREATGPNDPELATMLANLGGLRRRQGQFGSAEGSAENALKEALAVEERAGKSAGFGIAAIHNQWGLLEFDRGNYDKADQEFAKAVAIAETYPTPSNELLLAMIYNNLALLDRDRGDGEKALQLLRLSAEKLAHVGEDLTDLGATKTPRDATLLDNLADTYAIQGDMDCAEKSYNSADKIWEKLGPAHQDSIRTKVSLAGLKRERGDLLRNCAAISRMRPR
jgi:tetratricopeptide (TPR) repeat protein